MKREERLENVARIAKANQYAADQVRAKIEFDRQRGEIIQKEKADALATRFMVRR